MDPLVTAVITTYRRDDVVLARAIDSVLNQTYENIELVIVDDNGRDTAYQEKVEKLIKSYKNNNIILITHQENRGVQRARNNGIKKAQGTYIGFLDDDDEWLPYKISKQMRLFKDSGDENLGLVYGWYKTIKIKADNTREVIEIRSSYYEEEEVYNELLKSNFIGTTSLPLLKKEYVIDVGCFDENLPSSQDHDLWVRMAKKYRVAIVEEPLLNYYYYSGEKITNNPTSKINGLDRFFNKYKEDIVRDPIAIFNYHHKIGSFQGKFGNYKESRLAFSKARALNVPAKLKLPTYKSTLKSYLLQALSALKS